jgi:curved DNA-binding protein CbpA
MGTDPADDYDYYELLGLHAHADASQLRRAWRRLALRWHPDRAGDAATATFQRIFPAYRVLADPLTRAEHDARRVRQASAPDASGAAAPRASARRPAPGVMLQRLTGSLNTLLACGAARLRRTRRHRALPDSGGDRERRHGLHLDACADNMPRLQGWGDRGMRALPFDGHDRGTVQRLARGSSGGARRRDSRAIGSAARDGRDRAF